MKRIETGVDRLVELVAQKKKVSVEQAAKALGVSKLVVTEWAEFLSDEGLVTIDYSLSRTYIKEKELSASDVDKKAKHYQNKRESFVRKVETSEHQLQMQTKGFESIKKQFGQLKNEIGAQIHAVREELDELRKYEKLKSQIDDDIKKETSKYHKQIGEASVALSQEQKRYESLLHDIEEQQSKLKTQTGYIRNLRKLEDEFATQQKQITELLDRARKELRTSEKNVELSEKHIEKLAGRAERIHKEIERMKQDQLDPLRQQRDEHEAEIARLQDAIKQKAADMKKVINKDVQEGTKAAKEFDKFFKRRVETQKLIGEIDKDKHELEVGLEELKRAAIAFKIAAKGDNDKHLKELEKKYADIEKKRREHRSKLQRLVDMIIQ